MFDTLIPLVISCIFSHGSDSMNWREPSKSSSSFPSPPQQKDIPTQDHTDNISFLQSRMFKTKI